MEEVQVSGIAQMLHRQIEEEKKKAAILSLMETARGLKRLVTPELFRVLAVRGRTRWRYGINHVAAARHMTAAVIYASVK